LGCPLIQKLTPANKMALMQKLVDSPAGAAVVHSLLGVQDANKAPAAAESIDDLVRV
jgi:hypothetical protein